MLEKINKNLAVFGFGLLIGTLLHMRFGEPRSEIKEIIVEKEVEKKSSSTNMVASRKLNKKIKPNGASEEMLEEIFVVSDNSTSDVSKEKSVQNTTKFNSNGLFAGGGFNHNLRPLGAVTLVADPLAGTIIANTQDEYVALITLKLLEW